MERLLTPREIFDLHASGFSESESENVMSFDDFERTIASTVTNNKNQIEYWKKRCELAEEFIEICPVNSDDAKKQKEVFLKWQELKNSARAGIEPESIDIELNEMAEKFYPENLFEELYQKEK